MQVELASTRVLILSASGPGTYMEREDVADPERSAHTLE